MKKHFFILLGLTIGVFETIGQELEVLGNVRANSLQIINGAGDQKILLSDVDGNAVWSDFPSRERSILIHPKDFSPMGSTLEFTPAWFLPTLNFADAGTPVSTVTFPFPADYKGGGFKIKILYTSSTNTGDFKLAFGQRGIAPGSSILQAPSGGIILGPPSAADELIKFEILQPDDPGVFNANSELLYLYIRRDTDDDILDTSTGILKIVGVVFSYTD